MGGSFSFNIFQKGALIMKKLMIGIIPECDSKRNIVGKRILAFY